VSRDSLEVVVGLRRLEERQRRVELVRRLGDVERAKASLGVPPETGALVEGLPTESFLAERARLHTAWAVYGARLERSERATSAEAGARSAWATAAADLRSAERLLGRRRHRAHAEAARRAQRDMDEVAIVGWRRGRGRRS
jgi:hypothetical protein